MLNKRFDEILNKFAALRRSLATMTAALKEQGTVEGIEHLHGNAEAKHMELAKELSIAVVEERESLENAAFCAPDGEDKADYRLAAAKLILLDGAGLRARLKQALHDGDFLTVRAVGEMCYETNWDLFREAAENDNDLGALQSQKTKLNLLAACALDVPEYA